MNQLFNEDYLWIATPSGVVQGTIFVEETAASMFLPIETEQSLYSSTSPISLESHYF